MVLKMYGYDAKNIPRILLLRVYACMVTIIMQQKIFCKSFIDSTTGPVVFQQLVAGSLMYTVVAVLHGGVGVCRKLYTLGMQVTCNHTHTDLLPTASKCTYT